MDLISFTGGLATGEKIMASAAQGVRRVALELGGKNPNIVFDGTDFDTVVDNALTAAFLHSGQVCSAGARLIVQDSLHDSFVAELAARADRIRLGNGMDPDTECGPLISEAHRAKVERYIALGLAEGAGLLAGGKRPDSPDLAKGFFLRPTVFAGCRREMAVVQEEVFGPVVTVERFSTEEEAIRLGNDTSYGLAGAVWTSDAGQAERVAGALRHGTVWINDYHPYLPQAEWGGFGKSGIGRELGPSGLEEYQEKKHIYHNTSPAPAHWFSGSVRHRLSTRFAPHTMAGRVIGMCSWLISSPVKCFSATPSASVRTSRPTAASWPGSRPATGCSTCGSRRSAPMAWTGTARRRSPRTPTGVSGSSPGRGTEKTSPPITVGRSAGWYRGCTSGRAPSGSAASSSARPTPPVSGSRTATTCTAIRGETSGIVGESVWRRPP